MVKKMNSRMLLGVVPFLAGVVGTSLIQAPTACGAPQQVSKSRTLVDPESFSLMSGASLEQGGIHFVDDSSSATFTLALSDGSNDDDPNSRDAGRYPARYYVYVKCDRNRKHPASIKVGQQVCMPEYTGEIEGMLWEKFTPQWPARDTDRPRRPDRRTSNSSPRPNGPRS